MARRSGIGQYELRRANLSALLTRVHLSGPTTRAALTSELGLNRSTIGDLTAYLEAAGLVRSELPTRPEGTGRPSHVVVPDESVVVLAVSLDVDQVGAAVVSLGGVVVARRERRLGRAGHAIDNVVECVAQMCEELLALHLGRCLGLGIAVPGVVRADDGMVRFAPNIGWVDVPFTELLGRRLHLPIATGNDADLGVLAEHLRGAAVGHDDVAYITGGVGIGVGSIVGAVPLGGHGGYAGEFGHLPVDYAHGDPCRCGSRGCWETKVGENHLLEAVGLEPGGGPQAVAGVIAAAAAGDQRSIDAVADCARWIGIGLGAVINTLNPAIIVISGLLAQIWEARPEAVCAVVDEVGMAAARGQVEIRTAGLGGDSALIGAAELAFAPVLADPTAYAAESPAAAGD